MNTIKNLFDHMTATQALENGFTHHGSYYGIPLWVAPGNSFMAATKWAAMEPVLSLFHVIESVVRGVFQPYAEPVFKFGIGREIAK